MANVRHRISNWRQNPVRQTVRAASSKIVVIPLIVVSIIVMGILIYYYNIYTEVIDKRLRGDIFVRSSGIYAAPLSLNAGTRMPMSNLLDHLRKVGYLDKSESQQNEKRGQYAQVGNVVEVEPGNDTVIDGQNPFHKLRVSYGRDLISIQSIQDVDSGRRVQQALVEPELISSVINNEREKRKNIEYKDLPESLVNAIVAVEDRQFLSHPGINLRGIARALVRDYQTGDFKEGGSSITQQLVKNFFLKPEKTIKRKLSEAYISILLEQRLNKQEILAMYCNQIYLGQRGGFSINGFGQAARAYFGKDISQLTVDESAFLAGIIQSPNRYSPWTNRERAVERRDKVLDIMVEAGKLNQGDADRYKQQQLNVTMRGNGDAIDAPYFIDYLMRGIEAQFGDNQALYSMRIYSTVDLALQRAAYNAVSKNMVAIERAVAAKRKGKTAGLQAALVAMNPKTGEIIAMVGGRDYTLSQLNRAVDARRQPGSIFKPFVYAAGIELGLNGESTAITPATMFIDEPHTFSYDGKEWSPGNFGDQFEMRPMTTREALYKSKNVITVSIAERIGYSQVSRFAEKAGFTKVPALPATALGTAEATPLQMASAYTSFATNGKRVAPVAIKRITSKEGDSIYTAPSPEVKDVMSPQTAYIVTSILQDVIDKGTGTKVRQMGFNGIAAGKTGTSRDGWFAGYTPNLVCVVWVGFDDNSDIQLTGGSTAALVWADFMKSALQIRPELGGKFEAPLDGLVSSTINSVTGEEADSGSENSRPEIFLRGTEPGSAGQPLNEQNGNTEPAKTDDPNSNDTSPQSTDDTASQPDGYMPPNRKRRVNDEPGSDTASPQRPGFFTRLGKVLGFSESEKKAKPSPTPWTSGGVQTVRKDPALTGDYAQRPKPPETKPFSKGNLEPVVVSAPSSTRLKPTPTPFARIPAKAGRDTTRAQPPPEAVSKPVSTPISAPVKGSFILSVCADHPDRLALPGVCPISVKKRFELGKEPTRSCSAKMHR